MCASVKLTFKQLLKQVFILGLSWNPTEIQREHRFTQLMFEMFDKRPDGSIPANFDPIRLSAWPCKCSTIKSNVRMKLMYPTSTKVI